jgi:hypothetical protein
MVWFSPFLLGVAAYTGAAIVGFIMEPYRRVAF